MNKLDQARVQFTFYWESLNNNIKSVVISVGAILLAVGFLYFAKWTFPEADFSVVQAVVITAISGFIVNLIKNFVKTE